MPEQLIESVRRLDFALPVFHRLTWVNDQARAVWEPRLQAIARARPRIFAHATRAGLYSCALLQLTDAEISELEKWLQGKGDYAIARLDGTELERVSAPNHRHIVVGRLKEVEAFTAAWPSDQRATLDDLRNLPPCCQAFRNKVRDEWKLVDTVLAQALNTPGAVIADGVVQIASPKLLNPLPASLGLLPLAHTPCSFDCHASLLMAKAWLETARANSFDEEMRNLESLLSWPMEWSALHGIAEIRMPILKMVANTDATAETYRVRLLSDIYPDEGVTGLHFPFRRPHSAKITDSKSFKSGLSNPVRELTVLGRNPSQTDIAKAIETAPACDEAALRLEPRSSHILDETLARLRERVLTAPKIESLYLSNYFNVIRLSDGSTGACMNYFRFKSPEAIEKTQSWLLKNVQADPLLTDYLSEEDEPDLLQLSLKTCVVSALSQNLLKSADTFRVSHRFETRFFPSVESAVVIGFGGYMNYLIHMTDIKRIHVSDLWMHQRTRSIQRRLELYRDKFPEKVITFSDGSDNRERLACADLVSITGSAFCTGTMDALLEDTLNCQTVILQGQSAAVFPEVLFEKGVSLVSTTIKPANLMELARNDPQQFKALLEGRLPIIYAEPLS